MCLTINMTIHKKENKKYVPFVAETDLRVYKCLDYENGEYCTPFQYLPIVFENNMKHLHANIILESFNKIHVGIHSFHDIWYVISTTNQFHKSSGTKKHWAVIPKGSKFYIGIAGDVVSEDLIIFKRRKDYRAYKKEHDVKNMETFYKI